MIGPEGERGGSSPKGEPQDRQRGEREKGKGERGGDQVPRFWPQWGQNFAPAGISRPQREQLVRLEITGWPHPGQKEQPAGMSVWQWGHLFPLPARTVPQLTQRRASSGLSVPQLG